MRPPSLSEVIPSLSRPLEPAQTFLPDMILLDIGLPKLDGYEVARRLRQEPGGDGMILLAMTGYGQEEDRRRSREAGFDHHLVKPVDLDKLRGLLRSVRSWLRPT